MWGASLNTSESCCTKRDALVTSYAEDVRGKPQHHQQPRGDQCRHEGILAKQPRHRLCMRQRSAAKHMTYETY